MSNAIYAKEAGPGPNPFMKEWVTTLTALEKQSPIFRLRKADYSKHKAIIQIAENVINLSFDPDKNTVTWESKNPGFSLYCDCGVDWVYSKKIYSKPDESVETLVSPVFTAGNQQFDIAFERYLSTDMRFIKKYNIVTAPQK